MDILFEAAITGNIGELQRITSENPVILHYIALESRENPLHLACLFGHTDFAREMLILKPEFAKKLNPSGLSPLHMAAANGRVEMVKQLIGFDQELCRVKGRDMMTPLHFAARAGEVGVINEILLVCPECVEDVTIHGETALHLAVKSRQYESLEVLVDWIRRMGKEEIINVHDEKHNTALDLAVQMKEKRTLQLLMPTENVESQHQIHGREHPASYFDDSTRRRNSSDYFQFQKGRDSPSDARTALLVIAVLVATATYQVGLSPPGGTWQDNSSMSNNSSESNSNPNPIAGTSIMGTYNSVGFIFMIGMNSIGFSVSLSMIGMLTSRFPLRAELIICLSTLLATYATAMNSISPAGLRVISIVFNSVLPNLVPLIIYLMRKYLGPVMGPMRRSLTKYKVVRAIADYYG